MNDLAEMVRVGRDLLALGERVMLATLVETRGSSYRPAGAMMLSLPTGHRIGGVSGGCLEDFIVREGGRLIENTRGPVLMHFSTAIEADDAIPKPGCGGDLNVFVERFAVSHLDLLRAMFDAHTLGEGATLQWRAISWPAASDKHACIADAERCLVARDGRTLAHCPLVREKSESSGFETSQHDYSHNIHPQIDLLIFGAGDDAAAMMRQAKLLGWRVSVFDRRLRLATSTRFPVADVVRGDAWERILPELDIRPGSVAVVMTHSFTDDVAIVAGLARHNIGYVGLLGPEARRDLVVAEAELLEPRVRCLNERLHGPAGYDLGVKSPEAVAVSIVAEILSTISSERQCRQIQPLLEPTRSLA